jgi:hypothetical protein
MASPVTDLSERNVPHWWRSAFQLRSLKYIYNHIEMLLYMLIRLAFFLRAAWPFTIDGEGGGFCFCSFIYSFMVSAIFESAIYMPALPIYASAMQSVAPCPSPSLGPAKLSSSGEEVARREKQWLVRPWTLKLLDMSPRAATTLSQLLLMR